jgi:hypothetical protein
VNEVHGTAAGEDIFYEFEEILEKYVLPLNRILFSCSDWFKEWCFGKTG